MFREVLNAIFYLLTQACTAHLPGRFSSGKTVYTYFRNWRKDGTWVRIHDSLPQVRDLGRHRVHQSDHRQRKRQEAAMVSQAVWTDRNKFIKGGKRFLGSIHSGWCAAGIGHRQTSVSAATSVNRSNRGSSVSYFAYIRYGSMQVLRRACSCSVGDESAVGPEQVVLRPANPRPSESPRNLAAENIWLVDRDIGRLRL